MALETKLLQKLSQSLLMTPQLQQAIKLLQLGRLEYKEAIEKELLENPVLEELKDGGDDEPARSVEAESAPTSTLSETSSPGQGAETESPKPDEPTGDFADYLDQLSDWRGSSVPKGTYDYEDRPSAEATLTKTENLQDHLLAQLRFSEISSDDREIIEQVLGNLNKDGYLCLSYEEIAEATHRSVTDVVRVVDLIRTLDPLGVASRDLPECLLTQLENMGLGSSLESRIVRSHLDKLEKRRYDQIAKAEGIEVEQVYKAIGVIQTLEPRPGRPFSDEAIRYIIPDIYVYKVGSEYVISLNEDGLPKLRISPYYMDLLRSGDSENVPNKSYLTERLKAASWLIKSIHQRQNTIFAVTESIVKFQKDFLDRGIEHLKPLVLKDVANDIGMHESTVSRVTTNKYVHTPQGVFELKYFFTTGIKTLTGDVSSSAIKEKIKNIIGQESPSDPISDQKIVEMLKQENIDIARRTVAKYREALGIESSSKRKKLF